MTEPNEKQGQGQQNQAEEQELQRIYESLKDVNIKKEEAILEAESIQPGRHMTGWMGNLFSCIVVMMALYQIYFSTYGILSPIIFRAGHLLFALLLVFMTRPFSKTRSPRDRFTIFDMILCGLSIGVSFYIIIEYDNMIWRLGESTFWDIFLGALTIILVLEGARRTIGPVLSILCLIALFYAFSNKYIPINLGHLGFGVDRVVSQLYLTLEGIYGVATGVMAQFVYLFILFSGVLIKSGGGDFFIKVAYSLTGFMTGGPAKTAVFASAFEASISGSAVANVVGSGSVTIPMMKKMGYKPHEAAAIEAAASTAGIFTPPVMGAAAFILAEWVGVSYLEVVLISILPAFLYFVSVWFFVHFRAKKRGFKTVPRSQLPKIWPIIKEGWHFLICLIVLVSMMLSGLSPNISVVTATIILFISAQSRKKTRMNFSQILSALEFGARNTVMASLACACAGIIVGVVGLTGVGLKLSSSLVSLSGGSLFWAIQLCSLAALILGMGVPITPAYITLAILGAPALIKLGATPLVAHMCIFWYANLAELTPPVCISAYTAAALAGANMFKTGLTAMMLGRGMYLMPPLFVYSSLITGTWGECIFVAIQIFFGLIAICAALERYLFDKTNIIETILLALGGVLLVWPNLWASAIGVVMIIVAVLSQRNRFKEKFSLREFI